MANADLCSISQCRKKRYAHNLCEAHYTRLRRHGDPLAGRTSPGDLLAWIDSHQNHASEECLKWPFSADRKGYGMAKEDGRQQYVHQIMCARVHGAPPTDLHEVAHSCGKGHLGCVNPKHLRWATRTENHADKLDHGTHSRGEQCPTVKLSEDQARQILSLKGKMMLKDIASKFGISLGHVSSIHLGKRWAWLSDRLSDID